MPAAVRTIVWGLPSQLVMIQDAARTAGLQITAAGSETPETAADLSAALAVPRVTDLRQAVLRDDVELLLLTAPGLIEDDSRRALFEQSLHTICCQPQFGSIAELVDRPDEREAMQVVPMMRHSAGFRAAADALSTFGEIQGINVAMHCNQREGALFGRLFDALDMIQMLCGNIESASASLAGPLSIVSESLHELRGHLSLNVRFKSNQCACAMVSDQAEAWSRSVTILGENGCVRLDDRGFEWIGADGKVADRHREPQGQSPGELIGLQIMHANQNAANNDVPSETISLLAACEAARLSCLTGQEESPGKLIEMMSRP